LSGDAYTELGKAVAATLPASSGGSN